ncbi:CD74 molecule, major histocompatibility complex, class II invariant chain b [Electrophorus electricus]|uniref:Thyroglobulin type-1 domain-containing protein n=1 Tax=Electrophorus electricus TaxID=8005 RepID=A0A4W4GPZ3_ELEEL|nr:CD74 molecule, major histocompatibility complex, class II invariant chain b [Electrophorus electricus]
METPQGPLLRSQSQENDVPAGSQRGGSNRQAFKVAGLTLLATVLIVGQAFTAYMVYSQKDKLNTLERRSDRLEELSRRPSVMRAPMKMAVPMKTLPLVLDELNTKDMKTSSSPAPKKDTMTQCQKQAAGLTSADSFKPQCDENGDYLPQQCLTSPNLCWCVDKRGVMVPETAAQGPAQCNTDKTEE